MLLYDYVPGTVIFWTDVERLTKRLLKQGYVSPKLKSLLQIYYGRHHELLEHCEIFSPTIAW